MVIEKDIAEKILEDYDDVFADIVNVLLFNGKRIVQPDELVETAVHSQYKADDGKLHEQERDISKYWKKNGTRIAICGIENQTKVDKLMPMRIMGYDGASYRSQVLAEPPTTLPVVTMILHFGEERWEKPHTLKGMLDIPSELEPYVNDYPIRVFEIAWLTEEQVEMFTSDFKVVARFFANRRKKNNEEFLDDTEIKHVDEVLKLLSVMTKDARYEKILTDGKGEVKNMCEAAQRLVDQGKVEGENMLARLMSNLFALGRYEDAKKASESEEDRNRFYQEFGIIE